MLSSTYDIIEMINGDILTISKRNRKFVGSKIEKYNLSEF